MVDLGQLLPGIVINKLGQAAGAGEGQGADFLLHQFGKKKGGFAVGAAAGRPFFIEQRRIPENEVLAAVGRAIIIHHRERQADQLFSMFARIGDGGRSAE